MSATDRFVRVLSLETYSRITGPSIRPVVTCNACVGLRLFTSNDTCWEHEQPEYYFRKRLVHVLIRTIIELVTHLFRSVAGNGNTKLFSAKIVIFFGFCGYRPYSCLFSYPPDTTHAYPAYVPLPFPLHYNEYYTR